MMTVNDVYEKCNKNVEHWSIRIYDMTSNVCFGFCNSVYPYADIMDDIKTLEVDSFTIGYESLSIRVNQPYEEYFSEEEVEAKGYERAYPKDNSSKILYRKMENGVVRYAVVDILKAMFLRNQKGR